MAAITTAARLAALEAQIAALVDAFVASPPASKPRKAAAHTFASKAERDAGGGFTCACGRTGLRVAAKPGSFHRAPDGTTHTVA